VALHHRAALLGKDGEEIAANYLIERGYRILDQNWRIKEGELDLVALAPDGQIIFLEVKSRSSAAFGDPLESITYSKAMRIQRLALAWLATHQRLGSSYRIDAVGIVIGRSGNISIDYREGVL
jgi:putative endonuclease